VNFSRRKLFGFGTALAASATIPQALASSSDKKAIPPILLERECDGDWFRRTPEEINALLVERMNNGTRVYHGCGVRFQWYFGMNCECPGCYRRYLYTMEDLKAKRFFVDQNINLP